MLEGLEGSEHTLLIAKAPPPEGAVLERETDGAWEPILAVQGADRWVIESLPGARYRLSEEGGAGAPSAPEPLSLSLLSEASEEFLQADDPLELSLRLDGPGGFPSGALQLLRSDGEASVYLDGDCLAEQTRADQGECWTDAPADYLALSDLASTVEAELEGLALPGGATRPLMYSALLTVELDPGVPVVLSRSSVALVAWDGEWIWGDLHAHSNLSMDGCEDPSINCEERSDTYGGDFFQQARDRGLDFAALTDHAEYISYQEDEEKEWREIWPEQVALVQEADDGRILPILGYEWTYSAGQSPGKSGHFGGGHKTVLLEDTEGCESARIAAPEENPIYTKALRGAQFQTGNPYLASRPEVLWQLLDASDCGAGAALTFFHHGAYEWPQPVDWTFENNTPDERYEMLVEIYSEHGSSECWDTAAPSCDWHLRSNSLYWGQGSVQAALTQGYRLGFVASTDSHDGRPGSTEDDPSCTAGWEDTDGDHRLDTPQCHDWTGGVTGVMVPSDYERADLFSGLRARRTLASSGPRPSLKIAAFSADGQAWLPGSEIPYSGAPLRIRAELDPAEIEVVGMELIDALGEIRLSTDGYLLDGDLVLSPGEAIYLRAHLGSKGEHRLWASPWFVVE